MFIYTDVYIDPHRNNNNLVKQKKQNIPTTPNYLFNTLYIQTTRKAILICTVLVNILCNYCLGSLACWGSPFSWP